MLIGAEFAPGEKTVLIFESEAGEKKSEFIVRLARFRPDIVFEWENLNDQGTVHIFRKAVAKGRSFTLNRLFQVGVDSQSPDAMTLWLSDWMYKELGEKGKIKIKNNRLPMTLEKKEHGTFSYRQDKVTVEAAVFRIQDSRGGSWTVLDDAENPLIVGYESRYYKQRLKSVASRAQFPLRWIKKLPPVR